MDEHKHDYRKLNDDAVFCRGCGDIKTSAPAICTLPHYQPSWIYIPPTYPQPWPNWWRPQPWVSPFIYSGTSTVTFDTVTTGDTFTAYPPGSSYSLTAGES